MRSSFFWDVTQRTFVVSYRRFGTVYRPHQGSSSFLELLSQYIHTKSVRSLFCFSGSDVFGAVCLDILEEFLNPILEEVCFKGMLFQ